MKVSCYLVKSVKFPALDLIIQAFIMNDRSKVKVESPPPVPQCGHNNGEQQLNSDENNIFRFCQLYKVPFSNENVLCKSKPVEVSPMTRSISVSQGAEILMEKVSDVVSFCSRCTELVGGIPVLTPLITVFFS